MHAFAAKFFDGIDGHPKPVVVTVDDEGNWHIKLKTADLDLHKAADLAVIAMADVKTQAKVGSAPRVIFLPEKQQLLTTAHETIDAILKKHQYSGSFIARSVTYMESNLYAVFGLLASTVAFCLFMYFIGLPAMTNQLAAWAPKSLTDHLGRESLEFIDQHIFSPTSLSEEKQHDILTHFQPLLDAQTDLELNVIFRDMNGIANAMALPDGTIIFTDQLVNITDNNDQLEAILAHEIGHVHHRHSMKSIINSHMLQFVALFVGVSPSVSDVGLSLINSSHSREAEREADDFAVQYANEGHYEPIAFADAMQHLVEDGTGASCERDNYVVTCDDDLEKQMELFSTHPVSTERIQKFLTLQQRHDKLKSQL